RYTCRILRGRRQASRAPSLDDIECQIRHQARLQLERRFDLDRVGDAGGTLTEYGPIVDALGRAQRGYADLIVALDEGRYGGRKSAIARQHRIVKHDRLTCGRREDELPPDKEKKVARLDFGTADLRQGNASPPCNLAQPVETVRAIVVL